ncbi:hypothetical protein H8B06_05865 [Sphingobacterium sp. DN00404]|uniref:Alpha/beta hydrolase n=1 Tax=Sphingobacterium micropteri TaxID=2763501 RepID=A0ABR7YME2_9SPHI|nr:hypothetical protein [Sphingobacterium micropteri]MBD1432343.1 hypothetical protein [Sphingobacterium micropteri]
MKIIAVIIVLFLLSKSLFAQQHSNVLYGERDLYTDTGSIYLDKAGIIYPKVRIPNDELGEANSSLQEWYKKNDKKFVEIARLYNCNFESYNDINAAILNDSIIETVTRNLNKTPTNTATFLIHGFRKPFDTQNGDSSSPDDFETLAATFKKFNSAKTKIVSIYWDALYGCCFSASSKKNKPLFELFELAQAHAEKTGNTLRKIVSKISKDTLNVVSHSLGAKVALYALLDISKIPINTPKNSRVNICLIAPAISANLIIENYMKRQPENDIFFSDNYNLYLAYNEHDFVLRKKDNRIGIFGPGPYKYGNTTLGCNYKREALKLQSQFNALFKFSGIKLYDLSNVGKCHLVSCYCFGNNLEKVLADMKYR